MTVRTRRTALFAATSVGAALLALPAAAAPGDTVRVNLTPTGGQSTGYAEAAASTADGSAVLFVAGAPDLTDEAAGGAQLYRRVIGGATSLLTVSSTGQAADSGVHLRQYDTDADGTVAAFASNATNLTDDSLSCVRMSSDRFGRPVDTPITCTDVFVHDSRTGSTVKASVDPGGIDAIGHSYDPQLSDDGQYLLFGSDARNLVAGDTNSSRDLFLRDLSTGTTRGITTGDAGHAIRYFGSSVISADGRKVAFTGSSGVAGSTTLHVLDVPSWTVTNISPTPVDPSEVVSQLDSPSLSGDGRYIAFTAKHNNLVAGDTSSPDTRDAFLYDTVARTTRLLNRSGTYQSAGDTGAYLSDAGTRVLLSNVSTRLTGDVGAEGERFVPLVLDLVSNVFTRLDVSDTGVTATSGGGFISVGPRALDRNGTLAAFSSAFDQLVDGDTNGMPDAFLRRLVFDSPPPSPGSLAATLDGTGGTFSTAGTLGAGNPVMTTITAPGGVSGALTAAPRSTVTSAPVGLSLFGTEIVLEGPASTAAAPYTVTFTVHSSQLGTVAPADVQVLRDGVVLTGCTSPTAATPDPCIVRRGFVGPAGDAEVVVRTSHFSTWSLGRLAYALSGPLHPVDPLPAINTAKAGAAIPVKFRLGGDRGLSVIADGFPFTTATSCSGAATDEVERTVTPGGSALSYDAASGTYTYVWKTTAGMKGCRDLVVQLRDGSSFRALFKLR